MGGIQRETELLHRCAHQACQCVVTRKNKKYLNSPAHRSSPARIQAGLPRASGCRQHLPPPSASPPFPSAPLRATCVKTFLSHHSTTIHPSHEPNQPIRPLRPPIQQNSSPPDARLHALFALRLPLLFPSGISHLLRTTGGDYEPLLHLCNRLRLGGTTVPLRSALLASRNPYATSFAFVPNSSLYCS